MSDRDNKLITQAYDEVNDEVRGWRDQELTEILTEYFDVSIAQEIFEEYPEVPIELIDLITTRFYLALNAFKAKQIEIRYQELKEN